MATATPTPNPTPTIHGLPRPLARALEAYADRLDVDKIREAYDLAVEAHGGQTRASGEEYVNHTIEVATLLAQLRLDTASIISGLIHDTVEDTAISLADLEKRFGKEVATIVDGVTKLGKVQFQSATEQQVENYRKMLLSMAEDARVILVKLADRVHNMRTLEHLPEQKRRRIALETREIYAPLAHRLGMAAIRWELEDLAFKNRPYDDIYDLMAMRVLTDTVENCYSALGIIHSRWTPIPERFHDYIATPKSNMYRSLHTTVFGPGRGATRSRFAQRRCTAHPNTASRPNGATRRREGAGRTRPTRR